MSKPVIKQLRPHRLNRAQRVFVDFLLAGMSPGEAAEMSGYARGGAKTYSREKAASVLLSKPWIAAAIRDGKRRQRDEAAALRPAPTKEELLSDLADIEAAIEGGSTQWEVMAKLRLASERRLLLAEEQSAPDEAKEPPTITVAYTEARHEPLPNNQPARAQAPPERVLGPDPKPEAANAQKQPQTAFTSNVPDGETVPAPAKCEKHGSYRPALVRIPDTKPARYIPGVCPRCQGEAEQAERRLFSLAPGALWRD